MSWGLNQPRVSRREAKGTVREEECNCSYPKVLDVKEPDSRAVSRKKRVSWTRRLLKGATWAFWHNNPHGFPLAMVVYGVTSLILRRPAKLDQDIVVLAVVAVVLVVLLIVGFVAALMILPGAEAWATGRRPVPRWTMRVLKGFSCICSDGGRETVELSAVDIRRDAREMRNEGRSRWLIAVVVLRKVLRTMCAIAWEGLLRLPGGVAGEIRRALGNGER
jgi:hypothetical protein